LEIKELIFSRSLAQLMRKHLFRGLR
jgi:hypothetical protein